MANAPVNIVYPIHGRTYPITDPGPGTLDSAYITTSFCLTLGGGPAEVEWGIDSESLGKASFYDQFSAQQVWKVPGGPHRFWVRANQAGTVHNDAVSFDVGS